MNAFQRKALDCAEKEWLNCYTFRDRNNKLMKKNL